MKTKQLIFAMCCMAAMASCSNEEPLAEAVPQAKQVSLTLTYGDDADTRTSFETSETGGLKHVWSTGDKVHLSYNDGSSYKTLGILDLSSGAGTNKATFKGTISDWSDGEEKTILVKYGPLNDEGTEVDWSSQEGTLESLGKSEIIFYSNVVATLKGDKITISSTGYTYKSTFICLPEGLKILDNGSGTATLSMKSPQFASKHRLSSGGWTIASDTPITTQVTLTDGKLASDVYLAAYRGWTTPDVSFTLTFGEKDYKVSLTKSFENGKLFTVPQNAIDAAGGFK